MKTRIGALAALTAALALVPAAYAAPTKVKVRVEGATKTLFEGTVTTDAHPVDGHDGSGPQTCDGTNAGASTTPGPTATGAFDTAATMANLNWVGNWNNAFQDFLISKIGPDSTANGKSWTVALNDMPTSLGGCQTKVAAGDEVLFYYANGTTNTVLRASGPKSVRAGRRLHVKVVGVKTTFDPVTFAPTTKIVRVKGARIGGRKTNAKGIATLRVGQRGVTRLKARKAGTVRSNQLAVKVK
jgi:hypothetical protein